MTHYNFATNIEERMPTTGKVYFVNRMTSDYAVQHPFDVDAYLEQVYQKWQDCKTVGFRETREALRRQWDATLGCRNPRGDARLYPNKNGEKHPALMEVWLKAGDYWRRGLRLGDVLPDIAPACKITHTENGWIALFPKDAALLNEQPAAKEDTPKGTPTVNEGTPTPSVCPSVQPQEEAPVLIDETPEETPVLIDETPELIKEAPVPAGSPAVAPADEAPVPADPLPHSSLYMSRERQNAEIELLFGSHSDTHDGSHHKHQWLKFAGLTAAACVSLLVVFGVGLIIPLGLAGLTMSGLVK